MIIKSLLLPVDPTLVHQEAISIESTATVRQFTAAEQGELFHIMKQIETDTTTEKNLLTTSIDSEKNNLGVQYKYSTINKLKDKLSNNSDNNEKKTYKRRFTDGQYDIDKRDHELKETIAQKYDSFITRTGEGSINYESAAGEIVLSIDIDSSGTGGFLTIQDTHGDKRAIQNAKPYLSWIKNMLKGLKASPEQLELLKKGQDISGIVGLGINKNSENGEVTITAVIDAVIKDEESNLEDIITVEFPMSSGFFETIACKKDFNKCTKIKKDVFFNELDEDLVKVIYKRFKIDTADTNQDIMESLKTEASDVKGIEISYSKIVN